MKRGSALIGCRGQLLSLLAPFLPAPNSREMGEHFAHLLRAVAAELIDLTRKTPRTERLQHRLDWGKLAFVLIDHQIVTFFPQRNEGQSTRFGSDANRDSGIRFS